MDFTCPFPEDHGFNTIVMFTDHAGSDICTVPTHTTATA